MIESFIILLREGIEVALIIGILIVYLQKMNRPDLISSVYSGLGIAAIGSVVGAIIFRRYGLQNESLEGYLLLAAALFVATMLIWMWKTARGIRHEIEHRVERIILSSSSWQVRLGVFLFALLMVLREGIETALFLGAVSFNQGAMQSFIGGLLGLLCAIAFGVLFIKGSVRVDIARFLKVTALVLLIFVAQLLVNALHEFYETGILSPQPALMGIIGPIVRNNLLFILAVISLPAFMFIVPSTRNGSPSDINFSVHRGWRVAAGLATLSIVFFLGFDDVFSSRKTVAIEPVQHVSLNGGSVHLELSQVDDGVLHRYALKQDSIDIRFFVFRTGLNTYATAFDACRPCYNYGKFYVSGSEIICSQCDAAYPLSRLSRPRVSDSATRDSSSAVDGNDDTGCFPIFLRSRIESGELLINGEDLISKREYFELRKEEP